MNIAGPDLVLLPILLIIVALIARVLVGVVRLSTRKNPAVARPVGGIIALVGVILGLFALNALFAWLQNPAVSTQFAATGIRGGLIGLLLAVAGIWLVLSPSSKR